MIAAKYRLGKWASVFPVIFALDTEEKTILESSGLCTLDPYRSIRGTEFRPLRAVGTDLGYQPASHSKTYPISVVTDTGDVFFNLKLQGNYS